MEWLTILKVAVEVAAAAKTLLGFAKDIYQWFDELIQYSNDKRAQEVWEDFKRNPEENKEALAQVAMHLKPDEDPVLKGYILGVAKQNLQTRRGQIYSLLTGSRYTFAQVQDVCARMDPALSGLDRNFSKQEAARWVVELAVTQERLWDKLINAMLETNPEVISEVVTMTSQSEVT